MLFFSAILAYKVIDLCRADQSFIWVLLLPLLGVVVMAVWIVVVAGKIEKKLEGGRMLLIGDYSFRLIAITVAPPIFLGSLAPS